MNVRYYNSHSAGGKQLSDVIPLLRIENDLLVLKDGRVAIGYQVTGSPFESMYAGDYERFAKRFDSALCALPEDYMVQKIDIYSNAFYPERNGAAKGFFERETLKYFSARPVLKQITYLFIISNAPDNRKKTAFSNSFLWGNTFQPGNFKNLDARVDLLERCGASFVQSLRSSGNISALRLNSKQMKELYYRMLSCDFSDQNAEPCRNMVNDKSSLVVGERKINVVSMEQMGEEVFYSIRNDYGLDAPYFYRLGIYLQFPHITVTDWYLENHRGQLHKLDQQRNQQAVFSKVGGQSAEIKHNELATYTAYVRANDLKFISISTRVVVFNANERSRELQLQRVRDAFRLTYNTQPLVETFDNALLFFSCLPGASGQNLRWNLTTNELACAYANFTHEFLGKNQGDYICDRFRNMVYIDLFDRSLNNQNSICIGPSGSGKSFTLGHFILQRYERRERQIIIDVGGSYKNILEGLGSGDPKSDVRYFEYSAEYTLSFNPFRTEKDGQGRYVLTEDKTGVLLTLLSLLIKGREAVLGPVEWPILQGFIENYYLGLNLIETVERPVPSLAGFFAWLQEYVRTAGENTELKLRLDKVGYCDLAIILEPYISGKYSGLFNSNETIDLSEFRLVCFDMARIKDDKHLYPVVSFLLIEMTLDMIRRFPGDRKYFTMDEAWSMLSEGMGGFVEYLYRTIRKCNGSMCIITQGVDELEGGIGSIIKNKCETKIILNHSTEAEIKKVGLALGLTSGEMQKIGSIRVNDECRELFIKQGNQSNIFVLEVPPSEHALLTSNPVERNHLNKLKAIYKDLAFAIRQWEEDKENGLFKQV